MAVNAGVEALLRIGRNTADLDRTIAFYRDALGFQVDNAVGALPDWTRLPGIRAARSRRARLSLGGQTIEFTEFPDAAPYPPDSTACDLWFQHCAIVVADIDVAYERVRTCGARAISQGGPQTLPPATGAVSAFKFRDPDGHPLELLHFPAGSGDPAWQATRDRDGTALGIDHSAISVVDVERSIAFYVALGLHVAGRSLNHGCEQQRLDGLIGVEVAVVALQSAARCTPHLELLGYRTPRGRAMSVSPVTAIAADRLIWQARDIDRLLDAAVNAGFADALVACDSIAGATLALLRDPDGHLLMLTTVP